MCSNNIKYLPILMRRVGLHLGTKLSEVWCNGRQFKPQFLLNSIQSLPMFSFNCCHSRETSLAEIRCGEGHQNSQGLLCQDCVMSVTRSKNPQVAFV